MCWVPSNTDISRNDQADKAARSTINLTTEKKFKIPHTDFKMNINTYYTKDNNTGTIMKIISYYKLNTHWGNGSKTKRGGYIVQTPDRSYKDSTLLFTRRKITSVMHVRPNTL